jgi:hypothetical protein
VNGAFASLAAGYCARQPLGEQGPQVRGLGWFKKSQVEQGTTIPLRMHWSLPPLVPPEGGEDDPEDDDAAQDGAPVASLVSVNTSAGPNPGAKVCAGLVKPRLFVSPL